MTYNPDTSIYTFLGGFALSAIIIAAIEPRAILLSLPAGFFIMFIRDLVGDNQI